MNPLTELASGRFVKLPAPVQIGLGVAGSLVTLAFTWFAVGNSASRNTAMIIVTAGIVCVVLAFLAFRAIIKWNAKRKANPLAQGIAGNAAAAPQGVSEPARRARLDDLRRNFEQGVEKFRAAGKNLYSVPWYVLVGEPGSGKTEAIRHCNVGFPPGLQDQLQGAGGTLNMNWWFTNSAIILDTAGRLMFEEVAPGSTNEWNEFLKLLKQNRPNSPVNGLLLVIPVDTLIKDTADAIEKKATKIAQQFDQIQRTLGVRFPVFVIVTKCDLLNGFREFFDDLNDPQLQHQIMGWSNPAPLDERFDPAKVTAHLESVKQRLVARRQNLLLDPVHSEDPQARRVDQVDALYGLPDSIIKIGPRLRRYLEMIFVAGEWSPKPLFLRGIYFTSSMTEGAALDAELAEALGVPVDSIPGGAIFRKDRAYFLRDLFLEKVFREKGLVTRATNADKQQQTRRMAVLGFGFLAVVILFAVTWFGASSLKKSLGAEREFWESAAGWNLKNVSIFDERRNNAYAGEPNITVQRGSKPVSLPDLFGDNLERVKRDLSIPFVFKPMTVFSKNVNVERRQAYCDLYESTVLRPAYGLARAKVTGDAWDAKKGTGALAELMKLEYAAATGKPPAVAGAAHPQVDVAALFVFALTEEDYRKFTKDSDNLQNVADWVYGLQSKDDAQRAQMLKMLGTGTQANLDAVNAGIDATVKYWQAQTTDNGQALESIKNVREALLAFREAETALNVASKGSAIDRMDVYRAYRDVWKTQMDKLRDASKRATEGWAQATAGKADAESIRKLYEDQKTRMVNDAGKAYEALLAMTPPVEGAKDTPSYRVLLAARAKLEDAKKALAAWSSTPENKKTLDDLAALDAAYFGRSIKGLDKADHRRFEVHEQLYELADKMVIKDDAGVQLTGALAAALGQADKDATDAVTELKQPLFQGGEQLIQAGALAQFTIEASGRAKKYLLARAALQDMPDTAEKWQQIIQTAVAKGPLAESLHRPAVPLVAFVKNDKLAEDVTTFSLMFAPDAAGGAADKLAAIAALATAPDAATKVLDPADLAARTAAARKGFDSYRTQYVSYWRDTVRGELKFSFAKYADFAGALVNVTESGINGSLAEYGNKMAGALERIGATTEANAIRSAPGVNADECKNALAHWSGSDLGSDPRQARRIILNMDAVQFRSDYFVATARTGDSYKTQYWRDLPLAALGVLAADGRQEITDSLAVLAKYERFPLAAPGDKKDDLTPDEILQARTALAKVRGASSVVAAAAGTPKLIGQGANTAVAEIDSILVRLRGSDLFRDRQDYFDKVDRFLAGLPVDATPLSATLTVNKTRLGEIPDTISNKYAYMPMSQGGKLLKEATLSATVADSAAVDYPGGDLALGFRQVPNGPIVQTETFPGPWAVLRLLASPNVRTVSREGNKWTLEYKVTLPDKTVAVLCLILEFKQPIPDLKEWPVPPGRTN
jgi:hypothetical protein